MKVLRVVLFYTITALLFAACKTTPVNTPTVDPGLEITQAVKTVYAQVSETARVAQLSATATDTAPPPTDTLIPETATPTLTFTPEFTLTPSLTLTETLPPVSHCPLAEVTRETVPPGSTFQQGQWVVKQWTVLNAGDCKWTTGYHIVYYDGDRFNQPLVRNFHVEVWPGDFIIITFEFAAPEQIGTHKSWWMMRNENGELFGNGPGDAPLYIEIDVKKADD